MTTATGQFWDEGWFVPQKTLDEDLIAQFEFMPGLKETLMVRQVHALEHATVWLLTEIAEQFPAAWRRNYAELGGMSTENGFYLYGPVDKTDLYRAVANAGDRLRSGEWNLAVHPRCGTNLSAMLFVSAALVGGASFMLPKDPFSQLIGAGSAMATAMAIAPEVGRYAQRYLTTAIPFNLKLMGIEETADNQGNQGYFVRLQWHNSQ